MMRPETNVAVPDVDFVINVFERTYRDVLQHGRIKAKVAPHSFPFRRTVLLVNNVDSRDNVLRLLTPLLASKEITEAFFVEDLLDKTLQSAGLSRAELGRTIHYTNCSLVAVFLPGSSYLLYSDADVFLLAPYDWITPALKLMQTDNRVAVSNPDWTPSTLRSETRETVGEFALGYGFSDQLYLIERKEFARPIYRQWAPISWRYPLSEIAAIFEQRVDSYMRSNARLRATLTTARYGHLAEEGQGYSVMSAKDRCKRRIMTAILKLCELIPGSNARYHV